MLKGRAQLPSRISPKGSSVLLALQDTFPDPHQLPACPWPSWTEETVLAPSAANPFRGPNAGTTAGSARRSQGTLLKRSKPPLSTDTTSLPPFPEREADAAFRPKRL